VRSVSARFWLFRYRWNGRMREMGLGSTAEVRLAVARDKAIDLHRKVKAGIDPLAEREAIVRSKAAAAHQAAVRAITFADVADQYITAHEAGWRNSKHRQQWRNTLDTYAMPILGAVPVADVDTGAVMQVLEPIWPVKTETASRLRGRIEAVLDYAKARGWRAGDNPAGWRGRLDHLLPARGKVARVEHHAALPWRETRAFMDALARQGGIAALALLFTVLTAARTGEAIGATWSEVDFQEAVWTIPARRMKAAREHRVPLSDAAIAVLHYIAELRVDADLDAPIFPGRETGKPLSNMAMSAVLRRMGRGDLTVHGFRSSFRSWCAEATNYPREVAEAALAHTLRDKTEAAYQRGDMMQKRRQLMTDWAYFCGCIPPVSQAMASHLTGPSAPEGSSLPPDSGRNVARPRKRGWSEKWTPRPFDELLQDAISGLEAATAEVMQDEANNWEVVAAERHAKDGARATIASACVAVHQRYSGSENPLHVWDAIRMCTTPDVAPMPLPDWVRNYLHAVASSLLEAPGGDATTVSKVLKLTRPGWNAFKAFQSEAEAVGAALLHDQLIFQGRSSTQADEQVRKRQDFADTSVARKLVGRGHALLRHVPMSDP
jgi:integrase